MINRKPWHHRIATTILPRRCQWIRKVRIWKWRIFNLKLQRSPLLCILPPRDLIQANNRLPTIRCYTTPGCGSSHSPVHFYNPQLQSHLPYYWISQTQFHKHYHTPHLSKNSRMNYFIECKPKLITEFPWNQHK